ncbi:MAG: conjugal transfer protein TraL [Neisseria sp.]|uniref:conjugal transfer protein TraL n=1 Tax=Neisseria sp. TaxID=192066 RepID=UPI0026DB496E|nr:conjugal transfer protein TraL [Neisseria sp.]MDO4248595.1 conjugal transfer protein TraL [Neisseria sp.]
MKEVHLIVQGKGGVGKSLISTIIAQYMKTKLPDESIHCYDTDPVNSTFSRYKALNAEIVNIMDEHNNINSIRFDSLIEKIIELDGIGVVDNGAATFVPLMGYLAENRVPELLRESGVRLILHVPLTGGQALPDCMEGLAHILNNIDSDAEVVVWINDHNGKVERDGKTFTDFKVYKSHEQRFIGIVHIVNRNPDTYGADIDRMTSLNLTFAEVQQSPDFTLMPRQRLRNVQRDLFERMAVLPVLANSDLGDE